MPGGVGAEEPRGSPPIPIAAHGGRSLGARGFFVASYGNVSDEVIMEDIRTQEATRDDDDFRVEDTRAGRLSRAFGRPLNPPASRRRWISSHTRQLTDSSSANETDSVKNSRKTAHKRLVVMAGVSRAEATGARRAAAAQPSSMRPQARRSDRRDTPARWDGAAPSLPARSPRAYVRLSSGRGGTRPEPSTWPCRHPRELEGILWAGDADPETSRLAPPVAKGLAGEATGTVASMPRRRMQASKSCRGTKSGSRAGTSLPDSAGQTPAAGMVPWGPALTGARDIPGVYFSAEIS
jgi:hypothetical protein